MMKYYKILSIILALCFAPALAYSAEVAGAISEKVGTIELQRDRGETRLPAGIGTEVLVGDLIVTGDDAKAKVLMNDNSVISLGRKTRFKITSAVYNPRAKERTSTFYLLAGKVKSLVSSFFGSKKNLFQIRSSTAVAGVRGTTFTMEETDNGTVVTVSEGSVEVYNAKDKKKRSVVLKKSEQTNVKQGRTPAKPIVLSAEQLASVDADTEISAEDSQSGKGSEDRLKSGDMDGDDTNGSNTGDPDGSNNNESGSNDSGSSGTGFGDDGFGGTGDNNDLGDLQKDFGDIVDLDVDNKKPVRTRIKVDF